jgi:hypothetical protein
LEYIKGKKLKSNQTIAEKEWKTFQEQVKE